MEVAAHPIDDVACRTHRRNLALLDGVHGIGVAQLDPFAAVRAEREGLVVNIHDEACALRQCPPLRPPAGDRTIQNSPR